MRERKLKAVAVKYDEGIEVPIIMAKGEGKIAQNIIDEAFNNNIPFAQDSTLVDLLGVQECGTQVPENAWKALAQIFSFILQDK